MTCLLMDAAQSPAAQLRCDRSSQRRLPAEHPERHPRLFQIEAGKLSFGWPTSTSSAVGTVELLAERQSKGIELAHVIHRDVPTLVRGDAAGSARCSPTSSATPSNSQRKAKSSSASSATPTSRSSSTSPSPTPASVPERAARPFDAFSQADSSTRASSAAQVWSRHLETTRRNDGREVARSKPNCRPSGSPPGWRNKSPPPISSSKPSPKNSPRCACWWWTTTRPTATSSIICWPPGACASKAPPTAPPPSTGSAAPPLPVSPTTSSSSTCRCLAWTASPSPGKSRATPPSPARASCC